MKRGMGMHGLESYRFTLNARIRVNYAPLLRRSGRGHEQQPGLGRSRIDQPHRSARKLGNPEKRAHWRQPRGRAVARNHAAFATAGIENQDGPAIAISYQNTAVAAKPNTGRA